MELCDTTAARVRRSRRRRLPAAFHTDGEREYAYDARPNGTSELGEALKEAPQRGWTVVSMKDDWKTIFPFE